MDENTFSALALIALVAVIAPLLSEAIRGRIPSVVIEIALGIAIGPYVLELAKVTPVVDALSVAGLTFLFFMAGYEIDMRRIRGRPLRLATLGWVGSLAIALAIAAVLYFVGFTLSTLLIALALTTTALGTLLPMLEDNHEMGTRFGAFVLAIGGAGEFFPIVAVAVLLSGRNPFGTAILLVAFIALSAAAIAIAMRPIPAPVEALLGRTLDTSSQLPVRIAVLIVLGLVWVASRLGLDVLLGAFAAGLVVRLANQGEDAHVIELKLSGLAFGLFVPVFFIVSGMQLDLDALTQDVGTMLRVLSSWPCSSSCAGSPRSGRIAMRSSAATASRPAVRVDCAPDHRRHHADRTGARRHEARKRGCARRGRHPVGAPVPHDRVRAPPAFGRRVGT